MEQTEHLVFKLAEVPTRNCVLADEFGGASALPAGGPSLFFLDLQTDQRATFERVLASEGATGVRIVPLASARSSPQPSVGRTNRRQPWPVAISRATSAWRASSGSQSG